MAGHAYACIRVECLVCRGEPDELAQSLALRVRVSLYGQVVRLEQMLIPFLWQPTSVNTCAHGTLSICRETKRTRQVFELALRIREVLRRLPVRHHRRLNEHLVRRHRRVVQPRIQPRLAANPTTASTSTSRSIFKIHVYGLAPQAGSYVTSPHLPKTCVLANSSPSACAPPEACPPP